MSRTSAPTLEQQFRFLWRLYDRDGDGLLDVLVGGSPCTVTSSSFGSAICVTAAAAAGSTPGAAQQVKAAVRGVLGTCDGCSFTYLASKTPTLASAEMDAESRELTLSGSGFDARAPAANVVLVGSASCSVKAATANTLSCVLPGPLSAGRHRVSLSVAGSGLAQGAPSLPVLDVPLVMTSLSHAMSSTRGGLDVTLRGHGLPLHGRDLNVTVCGSPATVKSCSGTTECVFSTPPRPHAMEERAFVELGEGMCDASWQTTKVKTGAAADSLEACQAACEADPECKYISLRSLGRGCSLYHSVHEDGCTSRRHGRHEYVSYKKAAWVHGCDAEIGRASCRERV